jgi:hypothetical protein
MRRALFILAVFTFMAVSGQHAHAKLFFGTQDKIRHLQDLNVKGPGGEALYLGFLTSTHAFLTSTHAFLLPYTTSDGGHVLGVRGVSDKFYRLTNERIELMQRGGLLPNPLPVYQRTTLDYIWGYALWPVLLIIGVAGFFSSRGRGSSAHGETRSA